VRTNSPQNLIAAVLLAGFCGMPAASAQLPSLDDPPWIGYFAVHSNKRFEIGLSSRGKIVLVPLDGDGKQFSMEYYLDIDIGIEEIMPDGRVIMKQIKTDSLESDQPATLQLEKTTVRGKVTGDARFELNIEQNRGIILIGGRIVDPGGLTQNPLRFVVRTRIPDTYDDGRKLLAASGKSGDRKKDRETEKDKKAFIRKLKDDTLELNWTDGRRVKWNFAESPDAASSGIQGPGITSATVAMRTYADRRFIFTASPDSSLSVHPKENAPLVAGFSIHWTADPAKAADGTAKLAIEVR
jgi:hypothetical protein